MAVDIVAVARPVHRARRGRPLVLPASLAGTEPVDSCVGMVVAAVRVVAQRQQLPRAGVGAARQRRRVLHQRARGHGDGRRLGGVGARRADREALARPGARNAVVGFGPLAGATSRLILRLGMKQ